jgi:NADPH:quinone reductase-like Zn-dependent oxidoreductase
VTRVKPGERVCTTFFQKWIKGTPTQEEVRSTLGGPLDGTLAEFMLADEQGLVVPPPHLDEVEAATLPCAAVTAWTALIELGGLRAGQTVLTQGSGGVALFALQFAKAAGARVIAITSTEKKSARLKSLGADETINYKDMPEWSKKARELTDGFGVDHVIELGGKDTLEQSLRAARIRGRVSIIGNLSGITVSVNLRHFIAGSLAVQGIFVGPRDSFENMNRAISQRGLRPVIDRVFPFSEAREAMIHMSEKKHFGKVCIKVQD